MINELVEGRNKVFSVPYVSQQLSHITEKEIMIVLLEMTIEEFPKIEVSLDFKCPEHKNTLFTQVGFMDKSKRLLIENLYNKRYCDKCEKDIDVPADSIIVYFTITDEYFGHIENRKKNPLEH